MIIDGLVNAIQNFIIFGAVLILRKSLSNEGLDSFLIHIDRKGMKLFFEGIIVGMMLIALYAISVVIFKSGEIAFDFTKGMDTFVMIIAGGIGFLAVAVFEEALFRGYIFLKLLGKFPLAISAALSSALFGVIHIIHYSSSQNCWVGIMNATLIGILLCVLVIKSGSLMLAIGYHLSWNLTQNIILSKQGSIVSLSVPEHSLTLSGGVTETEFLITVVLILMAIYVFFRVKYFNNAVSGEKINAV